MPLPFGGLRVGSRGVLLLFFRVLGGFLPLRGQLSWVSYPYMERDLSHNRLIMSRAVR